MRLVCALATFVAAGGVAADVGVNKSFAPNSVSAGQTSTLTVVFLNPNPAAATATAVTDTLPGSVVVASPANATTTCGGTVTATPGAGSVSLSGGTIPAAVGATPGQCQFTVGVLSNTPGTYINTLPVGSVSSSQGGNTQAAQATLVATALVNITGTKVFAPTNVHAGGSASTMTITLTNSNGVALTNTAFTDTFPANVVLDATPNLATTCAGGTVTGVAGGASVQLSAATIPANGSCTVTASVITGNPNAAVNATRTNTIAAGAVTTAQGITNNAISGNLTVQSGAALAKAFSPTTIASGNASTLTITASNFNATALGGITFTDTFPGTMVVANPSNASTTCGGTLTATSGAGSINLNGGSLTAAPAGATARTCTVVVSVNATNGGASPQTLTNTLAAGTFGTVNYTGGSANLIVNPASPITGTKSYSPAPVQSGTTTATVTLTNTTGSAATITSFNDDLTTLGAGFTVGSSPAPGGTCGATITAPVGGTLVTATGGSIPANGACTITFPITVGITVTQGGHTNTIAAGAVQTTQGSNTLAIAGVMDLSRAFTAAKAYAPATVQMGAKSTLTVTFTHNVNAVALSNLSFTDTLPAGHTIASPPNASTTCGGTLTATAGAGSFSLAGGALGAGATSCTVKVSVVAPASAGSAVNTVAAGAVTTAEGATNVAFTATLTRVNTSVTINKSFTPATVAVGGVSQLAIQIRNNNANAIQLTGAGLIDTLPAGMQVGSPAGLAFTGSGCSATLISVSGGTLTLSGATLNANSICTLTANMQATAAGNLINNLPIGIVTSAQGVTNSAAAAATLASSGTAFLSITKTDGVTTVVPGGTATYTLHVTNTGPNDVAGLGVNDAPAAGVTFTSWSCTATAGSLCTASGSGAIADVVTLLNGGTLTYTVNASFAANLSGTTTNTASLGVPGSVVNTNSVSSASDTDTLAPVTALAVSKSDGSATYTPGTTGVYTIVVTNGGPSDALDVTLADALPAGVTLSGAASCVAAGGASCGTVSGSAGATSVGATGVVVPAGGGAQLTFTVPVAFAAGMSAGSITNTVSVTDGPSGGSASASDTDTRAAQVALSATKSDGTTTYTPGGTGTYVVTIGNAGPSTAVSVTVSDPLPAGVTLSAAGSCVATAGSSCGALSAAAGATSVTASGASIAPGGSLTLTLPVRFGSAMTAATLTNTVSALDSGSGASASASDTDNRVAQVALAVTKTDGSSTYTPGSTATYTIVVTNSGPSDALAVNVSDALPAGVTLTGAVTCVAAGGAACGTVSGASGATSFGATGAVVPASAGAQLTFSVPVAFAAGMTAASITNTVTVTDTGTGNSASASDTDTRLAQVTLAVTKSDGVATYTPGGTATYVVTIGNSGLSSATNVTVSDALPAGVTLNASASCAASAGSSCGSVVGASGATSVTATSALIAPGGTLTLTIPVRFASGLASASLTNTVTVNDAGSGASGSASDSDTLLAVTSLAVSKSDGSATYTPGTTGVYTIVVTNGGPSDALDVTLADALPAGVTLSGAASCVAAGGASCGTVSGSAGATSVGATGVVVPAGGGAQLTFTVPVAFAAGMSAGSITNTVSVTDGPSGGSASASDTDTRAAQVALSATKSDGTTTYTPGGTGTYVVTIGNAGPSTAVSVTVSDPLPAGVTLSAAGSCVATAGSSCGVLSAAAGATSVTASGASIAPGGSLTLTLPVRFGSAMTAATLTNTVSATDAGGAPISASDTDTRQASVALTITKSDAAPSYTPGGIATYTIVVSNTGISDAQSVTIADALPAGVTLTAAPGCVAIGAASCGVVSGAAGGTSAGVAGAIVPAGAGNGLTLTLPVAFAAGMTTNPLLNTATVSDPDDPVVHAAVDSDVRQSQPTLVLGKSDGSATYTPGGTATYTLTLGNTGLSDAVNVSVNDALPAGVTLRAPATCVATGAASCGTVSGTAGQASAGVANAVVAAGAANGLTITLPVSFDAAMTADPLVNTASATDLASGVSTTASDSDVLALGVALAVGKSDGSATYTPGGSAVYTVVVTNAGPSNAASVTVSDAFPAGITLTAAVGCIATGNAACGTVTGAAGQTGFSATGARVGAGAGDALTFTVPVAFAAGLVTDPLVNTATATDAPSGNSASGSDSDARSVAVSLAVAKTDGSTTYMPGGTATYTVTVTNGGLSDALGVTLTDALPAGTTLTAAVTCAASGNAACGTVSGAAGQTTFGTTGARVGAGAGNAIAFSAPVAFASNLATDPLVNTADAIDVPSGAAGSGSDSDARLAQVALAVTKTDGQATYVPGSTATYVVQVVNTGASDALDVTVTDGLPTGVTLDAAVTCAPTGSASCGTVVGSAGQSAFAATAARIGGGGSLLTFTVPVRFASGLVDDPLVNTAGATDQASGASGSGSDSDARVAQVNLTVGKSDGSATYTPGGGAVYSVVVGNTGPTDARSVSVSDALPAGVSLSGPVTCATSGSASCGTLSGAPGATAFSATGASVSAGPGNLLTFSVPVAFAAGMTANPLVNTVDVTDVASGATASASDSDALSASVSLAVAKTDGSATYTPGATATYTITVTNGGSSDATSVTVSDVLPAGVTLGANVTCVAAGTSSCGTVSGSAGQASLGAIGARVGAGAGNALVFTVPVAFAPGLTTNPLVNTATAQDAVSGASGSASDADSLGARATLILTKTDNALVYVPGGAATYVVTLGNSGPSNATGVSVTDNLPAGVTLAASASCSSTGAATCGVISGAPGAATVVLAGGTLAAGAGNALVITLPVQFDPALVTDPLVNTASAAAQGAAPVTATDSDARAVTVGLTLTNTDNKTTYIPGDQGIYVLTLGNLGPSNAKGIVLVDNLPAGVLLRAGATCVAVGAATCGTLTGAAGGSTLTMSGGAISAGAGNRLIVNVPVRYASSLRTDPLLNPATATAAGGASASATDSDAVDVRAALALTKTDNRASYTPGGTGTYVVHLTNGGPSDATNVTVTDNLPAGVTLTGMPSCVATGAATCGSVSGAAGGGAFVASAASIPAAAGAALDYSLPVRFGSAMTADPLTNTATATADGGALAQGADSDVRDAPLAAAEIPVDDPRVVALLVLALALLAARRLARRA